MTYRFVRWAAVGALAWTGLAGPVLAQNGNGVKIEVLSSLPSMVTGGDALIRVVGTDGPPKVAIDGRDVSGVFKRYPKGGWVGLVDGLKVGDNVVTSGRARLTLTNHPINGTLFAGPQQEPFVCENEAHGLPKATDASCYAPTQVAYFYRSRTDKRWRPFDRNAPRPDDIDDTTNNIGYKAPLIVRRELGVINRAAYVISILHDPVRPLPSPTSNLSGWNGRVIYASRGGVGTGYHMGATIGSLDPSGGAYVAGENNNLHQSLIEAGYALVAGSLNVTGTTTNDVLQAETTAKIKERFIEQFGPPVFMIGMGTSGGSMSQHLVANNYPGLYDGILPWRSYPDVMSFWQPLYDCALLRNAFDKGTTKYTDVQKAAISGKLTFLYCASNDRRAEGNINPDDCAPAVKDALAADPRMTRPRCTYADNNVNIFGIDPKTGFARFPWDNVGVQYGLKALNDGVITVDQFIDINTRVGGHDINGKFVPQRSKADPEALRIAYATGRMQVAGAGLAEVPILDIRGYTDGTCSLGPCPPGDPTFVDVHDGYHTLSTRARLIKANGNANNHVRIVAHEIGNRRADSIISIISVRAVAQFDKWVTDVVNDTSNRPKAVKVAAHRPKDLVDACYANADTKITNMAVCDRMFPTAGDARLVAGAPRTDDILKCQLKPVTAADYKVPVTADQVAKLRQVFPDGVCDYGKPGVGQVPLAGTWGVYHGNAQVTYLKPRPTN